MASCTSGGSAHHEDVSDHLHALVMVIPSQLEFSQKGLPLCGLYLGRDKSQVLGLGLHQPIVQPVPKLVDHHIVGIPAEMPKCQDMLLNEWLKAREESSSLRAVCVLAAKNLKRSIWVWTDPLIEPVPIYADDHMPCTPCLQSDEECLRPGSSEASGLCQVSEFLPSSCPLTTLLPLQPVRRSELLQSACAWCSDWDIVLLECKDPIPCTTVHIQGSNLFSPSTLSRV